MSTLSGIEGTMADAERRWLLERTDVYQLMTDLLAGPPKLSLLARYFNEAKLRGSVVAWEGGEELSSYFLDMEEGELRTQSAKETEEFKRLFQGSKACLSPEESAVRRRIEGLQAHIVPEQINSYYNDCGVVFNKLNGEHDDSLAMELEFMSVMADRMQTAGELPYNRSSLAELQISFLENHLLKWAIPFSEELRTATDSKLYLALASLLTNFLVWDYTMLCSWREGYLR